MMNEAPSSLHEQVEGSAWLIIEYALAMNDWGSISVLPLCCGLGAREGIAYGMAW